MDKMKNTTKTEKYCDQIKELFREFATDELYDTWADTFEVVCNDEKHVNVYYHGKEHIKVFKKNCMIPLMTSVYSVLGSGKKVKIVKKKAHGILSSTAQKNIRAIKFFVIGMIFVCISAAVIAVMCNYITNRSFRETFYTTSSIKVDSNVRVVQLSDLHGSRYGKNNEKLLARIAALEPDIIICTGDMVDSVSEDGDCAVALAAELAKIAPSYYIYGNNEVESVYGFPFNEKDLDLQLGFEDGERDENALRVFEDSFEERLEDAGIKVLKNEKDTVEVKNMKVDVYGVLNSNPSSFWSYAGSSFADYIYSETDRIKITAVHEPFIFEEFVPDYWGDLMICGHTHGGVVRVPVLGPLYTHEGGLFPERGGDFVYGRYSATGSPLIVSSGLENTTAFRINNQPEIVIIDINKF